MRHRTFATSCNPPLDGIDYLDLRPFANWQAGHLNTLIGGWLQLDPPCLELATLALEELTLRQKDLNARMKFAAATLEPIGWLQAARSAIRRDFPKQPAPSRSSGHVYVILRGGYTEASGWYGAYVGSTRKTVAKRFLEHRCGGARSARGLPKYGIEPLYSLFLPIGPVGRSVPVLREWETRLHECLAREIPKVTGDVAF